MKKLLLSSLLLLGTALEAAPYYRVWRGFKKEPFTSEQFNEAIAKVFVPATVEYGTGKSLTAYIPAIPNKVEGQLIPDEIALVVYDTKERYEALRATPMGKAYGDLHWEYFIRAPQDPAVPIPLNASKSATAEAFPETALLENGKAYDLLQATADWQKGTVKTRFLKRVGDAAVEAELLKKLKSDVALKAQSFLILADANYFMTYELWENEEVLKNALAEDFLGQNFGYLGENNITATKTGKNVSGMQSLTIKEGEALSAQFDAATPSLHIPQDQIETYISENIKSQYSTLEDVSLLSNNDDEGLVERRYLVKYADETGIEDATHEEEVKYKLKRSVLSPDDLYLVITAGEVIR